MKISTIIKQLSEIKKVHGDIEGTCTGSLEPISLDASTAAISGKPFESTIENFEVKEASEKPPKRVMILWQK